MVEAVDTAPLRAHVRLLGDILGKIIREPGYEPRGIKLHD